MAAPDNTPFFILGAPRSGTTLLRDTLRLHPRLECPEETHFFRWTDPFGTDRFMGMCRDLKLFKIHRELDGIDEAQFREGLQTALNRKDLATWYGNHYLQKQKNRGGRWFDKTPQNVYGILMMAESWPEAKFVHIHRHPLNVVASLMTGAVMQRHDFRAALNAWLEAIMIINQFRSLAPSRLIDISYEELSASPRPVLERLLEYLGESASAMPFARVKTDDAKDRYRSELSQVEIDQTLELTRRYRPQFGYQ